MGPECINCANGKSAASPPYRDWADYLHNAPRVGDDFRAVMTEMRGNPLPLESREPLD